VYTVACEKVVQYLEAHGESACLYYGQLPEAAKLLLYEKWMSGELCIVVVMFVFGMGVDEPEARWVLHCSMPRTMEACVQEMGRAGRDDERSNCFLLCSPKDMNALTNKPHKETEEDARGGNMKMSEVKNFCRNRGECRHIQIMVYFGESGTSGCKQMAKQGSCGMCDVCGDRVPSVRNPKEVSKSNKSKRKQSSQN
jgi:bloom syndrome protein